MSDTKPMQTTDRPVGWRKARTSLWRLRPGLRLLIMAAMVLLSACTMVTDPRAPCSSAVQGFGEQARTDPSSCDTRLPRP